MVRHRLPVPAHPTCVLIASLSGLPKLSESARPFPTNQIIQQIFGDTPGPFSGCLCVRARGRACSCV